MVKSFRAGGLEVLSGTTIDEAVKEDNSSDEDTVQNEEEIELVADAWSSRIEHLYFRVCLL